MKLYIKYMVSIRCKMVVKETFKKLGLHYVTVNLGEVDVIEEITAQQRERLKDALLKSGLELLDDKKSILIERIKNVIVQMVHYEDELPKTKFSIYLSRQLKYDYTYLANIFSENQGITLEHFIILHKIEKVKELIVYDELNLTAIAWKLHYSSVSHLSTQFKKITGLTPTYFKSLKRKKLSLLENL
ncbi:MAG: helix-turn-helix transcriptional regulator [Terrimonas ferruginea]|uniref:helix-turn-helix domain-containing protein n=1 Tax=Terrimonas ferruginea TaxID=249 RepID=UPI00092B7C74|nr:AraC family transcriptional regulator [Terrimonas ferruginea]MBN8784057.1 helix-turn-helix transcriptional regulator [Terrimonas ferruginea]OJW41642.1 MAG: AraC family transcriptional regulator [Sphingobacteriales bacterium 48-107]